MTRRANGNMRCVTHFFEQDHDVPGQGTSLSSKVLNMGMSATENFAPLKKVCQHVCAFHFYAHDMTRQVRNLLYRNVQYHCQTASMLHLAFMMPSGIIPSAWQQ